ncbi:MAG: PQQ-binding-like beta-propeller repeat protein [Pirellulales bacterium]
MPLQSAARWPFQPPELIRIDLFDLMFHEKWDELDRFCRVLHFYGGRLDPNLRRQPHREPIMELVDWAAALAERRRTAPEGQLPAAPQHAFKPEWRHPLIEQFGKEGYNVLAELEIALQEKAYPDACRIITGVTAAQAVGLLPNAADADLLVSLPGAVALAMRTHPELRAAMQRDYGELAQLRFRQAAAAGEVDAVEALTTQFYGTAAAADAQMWLGDRALAQGDASRAEGHYQAARSELPDGADVTSVAARLRLAAAMQGRNSGDAPTTSVKLGEWTLSPAEFERTVKELRDRAPEQELGPRSASGAVVNQITSPLPPPSRLQLKPFAKLDGDVGRNPEQAPRRDVDDLGPQISTTFSGSRMIVSNRFQVVSFNLADGKQAWRTTLGNEQGRTHAWSRVAMPPVVVDGRIFVRRLTAAGPELACLDEASGRVVWRSPRGEVVASDALVAGDRVQVVVLATPQQETLEAVLTTFELRTGKVLSRRPLVMLRDYWKRELPVKLRPAGDVLLLQTAGCVIGCSPEGELRWLRRLPWLPTTLTSWSASVYVEGGVWDTLAEGKLRVPGLLDDLYEIDIRTGAVQRHGNFWNEQLRRPNEDGDPLDRYALFRLLMHGNDRFGVYNQGFARKLWRPRAFWSSATTGEVDAAWPTAWQKTIPSIGPLASHDGRYFAFTTNDVKSMTREIVELVPQAPLEVECPRSSRLRTSGAHGRRRCRRRFAIADRSRLGRWCSRSMKRSFGKSQSSSWKTIAA